MFTVLDNPIHDGNLKLLDFVRKTLVDHEDTAEECTCDTDYEDGCWYRLDDQEQMGERINALFFRLTQEVANGFPTLVPTES